MFPEFTESQSLGKHWTRGKGESCRYWVPAAPHSLAQESPAGEQTPLRWINSERMESASSAVELSAV